MDKTAVVVACSFDQGCEVDFVIAGDEGSSVVHGWSAL